MKKPGGERRMLLILRDRANFIVLLRALKIKIENYLLYLSLIFFLCFLKESFLNKDLSTPSDYGSHHRRLDKNNQIRRLLVTRLVYRLQLFVSIWRTL